VQAGVLGLVHDTHAAAAQLLDDPVMRDRLTEHRRECYGLEVLEVNAVKIVL